MPKNMSRSEQSSFNYVKWAHDATVLWLELELDFHLGLCFKELSSIYLGRRELCHATDMGWENKP